MHSTANDAPSGDAPAAPPPRTGKPRRWLRIVIVNVALCVAIVTGFLLWTSVASVTTIRRETMRMDPSGVWRFRANLRNEPYQHADPSLSGRVGYQPILLTTNADGFRDRDHALVAAPGTRRVAFVGDSFIFATNLQQDETLTARVEAELASSPEGADAWEIFNFGIPGLNLQGMGRVVQTSVAPFAPELVVYSQICDDFSPVDVLTVSEWNPLLPEWLSARTRDRIGRYVLPGLKEFRYKADEFFFDVVPTLRASRTRSLLAYLDGVAREHRHRVLFLGYCPRVSIADELAAYVRETGADLHFLPMGPYEEDHTNHPVAAANRRFGRLVADEVRSLLLPAAGAAGTAEAALRTDAPSARTNADP